MLIVLTTLLGTLSSMFSSRAVLELENLALRQQIGVLQRSARKRFKLNPADADFVKPAAVALGLAKDKDSERFGWHRFRHSLST